MRTFSNVSARFVAAVFAAASFATVAQAQHLTFNAQVNVPFAFETAAGQHFQPGVYEINMIGRSTVDISSSTGRGMVMVREAANLGLSVARGKVVFTHLGDRYYLKSVSQSDSSLELQFGMSKAEKESRVALGKSAQTVQLALLQASR